MDNTTRFPKTATFPTELQRSKIMGPNPLKLCEELLEAGALAYLNSIAIILRKK